MTKSRYSWLAVALALSGVTILTGHPDWGLVTGGAILILAGAVALGAMRTETERRDDETRIAGQKVSNVLVTASAAAIIAVYAAGFQRTRAAADEFEARVARRKAAVTAVAAVVSPESQPPTDDAPPPVVYPTGSGAIVPAPPASKGAASAANANSSSAKAGAKAEPRSAADSKSVSTSACWPNKPPEACVQPAADAAAATAAHYKDGTYSGTGTSHHGNIEVSVAIQGGQVASTTIATCTTRFTCSVVDPLSKEVIVRQNAKLDFISGATESSDAFAEAVGAALAQAGSQVHYKDGTYSAWGTSRHGNLEVSVVIEKGQIASAAIASCATNYPCSVVNPLLKQAVTRQGPNVDFLTGATDSSDAFAEAIIAALAQAHE